MIHIESFGALFPVVFSIPIYLFCQTSCSLSQDTSCPSSCDSYIKYANETESTSVCFNNNGRAVNMTSNSIKGDTNNGQFKIDGELVDTTTLLTCGGCKELDSGASTLHAGVVGVLLGSIALAFMS